MKFATIGALLALTAAPLAARADFLSYTAPLSGSWNDGGGAVSFMASPWNDAMGTLTGITLNFDGTATVTAYSAALGSGQQLTDQSLPLIFQVGGYVVGEGMPLGSGEIMGSFAGVGTDAQVNATGTVYGAFTVPSWALSDFTGATRKLGGLDGELALSAAFFSLNGHRRAFDGEAGIFNGTMTEVFGYNPAAAGDPAGDPVPEPGSLPLLVTAVSVLAMIKRIAA